MSLNDNKFEIIEGRLEVLENWVGRLQDTVDNLSAQINNEICFGKAELHSKISDVENDIYELRDKLSYIGRNP